jgi:sulfonate transport system ATP-binding protein
MRPHPGQVQETLRVTLPRPRDRLAPEFDLIKRTALRAVNRSLAPPPEPHRAGQGVSPWL